MSSRNTDSEISLKNLSLVASNNGHGGGYGLNLFEAQDNGTYTLDNVNVNIENTTSNGNEITKVQNLFYVHNGNGTLTAKNSNLTNSILTMSNGISNVIFNDTSWNMVSNSNITNLKTENSVIDLRNKSARTYNTLTVNKLTSYNTTFHLNTFLNGDGSDTDKLVITNSSTAGTAILNITSTGATNQETASNGILVVDQSAISTGNANNRFSLYGGVLDNGYWEYALYEGDINQQGNDWYLRTNG